MGEARWREELLSVSLALASGALQLRDRVTGVARRLPRPKHGEAFRFRSGGRVLAAVYVAPAEGRPVVLLCHGIGETVEHWSAVQAWFERHGVGSMVFNYSGYGRSTGRVRAGYCNDDALQAFAEICRRSGTDVPVFVLGFSLGSGISAAVADSLAGPFAGLFLCEAFSSFREAAYAAGAPGWLARQVPDVWRSVDNVRGLRMPLWVVHSDGDRLFPVSMAQRLVEAKPGAELILVDGLEHDEPYLLTPDRYWLPILESMLERRP